MAYSSLNNERETTLAAIGTLTPREELEIGVMIATEFMPQIHDGKLDSSEVREALREVVREVGIGYPDCILAEKTVAYINHLYSGARW
jgi:hypothetical protein